MTITTVNVACDVGLPDNTEFTAARLDFTLSGPDYDTVSNDATPAATISLTLDEDGQGTAALWPVDLGTRNTFYTVTLIGTRTIDGRVVAQSLPLGRIQPQSTGGADLANLLAQSSGGLTAGSEIYATLADAVAAALEAAAAGADPIAAIAAKDAAEDAADRAEASADTIPYHVATFADLATVTPAQLAVGAYVAVLALGGALYQRVPSGGHLDYSGAGGVRLNVMPGADGLVTPRQFGASPAASAATNGPILQAMLDAFPAYMIDGRYLSDRALTIPQADVTIRGNGPETSAIIFGATDGLIYDGGTVTQSNYNAINLFDFSILTTASGAGSAIAITYTGGGGTSNRLVSAQNVMIDGISGLDSYWLHGWDMDNVRYSSWINCNVVGSSNSQSAMMSAWRFGDSTGSNPVDNYLTSCTATFQARTVDIGDDGTGDAEGIYVTGCTFIANDYAIYWDTLGNKPLLNVNGGHFASRICCIYGDGLIQETISGTLLYVRDETTANFTAIDISSSTGAAALGTISGVVIRCNNGLSVTTDGIRINQLRTLVTGCTILGADTGIIFGANALSCRAIENSINLPAVAPYSVAGTGNIVIDSERGGLRTQAGGVVENYFEVRPQAGSTAPQLVAEGPGVNIGARLRAKGTGPIEFQTGAASLLYIQGLPNAANHIAIEPALTGTSAQIIARGSDTNLDLRLGAKGSGNIRFGTHVGSSDVPITGYIEIKDAGGTVRRLAVIG